ncbi:CDP-alcohol phosphatidyltransferase family protein [Sphaerisporangium fuscum]|uniref:CDP-alcohol phosphatidyltransferase family protein n=1 Tax=Sphaerisporangium fuscum TaxID=2835868 RepID=UPI0020299C38|nr:CDP-alcohol phosphatidyltransferase family protein [Sphaerisporangium fuscum]
MRSYSLDDVLATRKRRDSWWTVFMVDPVACRVALFVANHTEITPNALTRFSLILGVGSAACFAADHLIAGALLFYVSFMVDCVDGKIARLKGTGTPFGLWLDYVGDRIRVVLCAFGLAYGQYTATGRLAYVLLGAGIAILDLFRYVNAPQMKRVRQTVKARRRAARREELAAVREAMAVEYFERGSEYEVNGQVGDVLPPYDPDDDEPGPYDLAEEDGRRDGEDSAHDPYDLAGRVPAPNEPGDHLPADLLQPDHLPQDRPRPDHLKIARADGGTGHPPPLDPRDRRVEDIADHGHTIPRQASAPHGSFRPLPAEPSVPYRASQVPPPAGPPAYVAGPPLPPGAGEREPSLRRRVGECLARHRVRTHLMSGIEFHAAVFVVAPLLGPWALLAVTSGAGGLLVLNEIFLVYRMWQSTRALAAQAVPAAYGPDGERHVRTDPFYTGV